MAALWQAKSPRPTERPRQLQTNLRKCGSQPAHKSMSTVVESPASNLAHQLQAICFINADERILACPKPLKTNIRAAPSQAGRQAADVAKYISRKGAKARRGWFAAARSPFHRRCVMPQRRRKKPLRGPCYIFAPLRLCVKQNGRTCRLGAGRRSASDRNTTSPFAGATFIKATPKTAPHCPSRACVRRVVLSPVHRRPSGVPDTARRG